MKNRWLSVKEIAAYLDVRTETAYRWLGSDDKDMPGHKVGRHWKFKKYGIDQWIKVGGAAERNKQGRDNE